MSSSDLDHTEHRNAEVTEKPPLSPPRCQAHTSKVGLANFVMATERCKDAKSFWDLVSRVSQRGAAHLTPHLLTTMYARCRCTKAPRLFWTLRMTMSSTTLQVREKNRAPHCLPPFHPPPHVCPCATHPATPRSKGTKSQVTGHPLPRP